MLIFGANWRTRIIQTERGVVTFSRTVQATQL
jgi:hypothetical protein